MPTLQQDMPVEPGFDFADLDTAQPLSEKPRKARQPVLRFKPARAGTAEVDLLDQVSSAPTGAAPRAGLLRRIRDAILGKVAFHLAWMALSPLVLHPAWAIDGATAVCAGIARLRGYKIDKTPDTDGGRAVSRAFGPAEGPKPGLVGRVLEPIKNSTTKPVAVVTAGAKKAVGKAEQKADELKAEVKEEATEIKGALLASKAAAPGEPGGFGEPEQKQGLIAQAGRKLSDAKDAVVGKVSGVLGGETLTPEQVAEQRKQAEKQRDAANRAFRERQRVVARRRTQTILGEMGRQQMAAAAGLAAQSEAQNQQRINEAFQWHNQMTEQLNRRLRGQQ